MLRIKNGYSGIAINLARCCHPLPGEPIVGIFTTGKGVTVHRKDCGNLSNFSDAPELWMDVAWEHEGPRRVLARLNTVLSNEPGSLAAMATIIGQQGGNISNIHLTDRNADFFSFGTNDLTQTTFGISRDDSGKFLNDYIENKIFDIDPFVSIDDGVGDLIEIATLKGRKQNKKLKLGICGEHGGDPKSINFCSSTGLNYVSCSPYRVPVARLAAAQAQLKKS